VAESFVGRFRDLAFGVSLSAGADVVIAGTATAANFSVTLIWHRSVRIGGDDGTLGGAGVLVAPDQC
jgi:hypothetical protein